MRPPKRKSSEEEIKILSYNDINLYYEAKFEEALEKSVKNLNDTLEIHYQQIKEKKEIKVIINYCIDYHYWDSTKEFKNKLLEALLKQFRLKWDITVQRFPKRIIFKVREPKECDIVNRYEMIDLDDD